MMYSRQLLRTPTSRQLAYRARRVFLSSKSSPTKTRSGKAEKDRTSNRWPYKAAPRVSDSKQLGSILDDADRILSTMKENPSRISERKAMQIDSMRGDDSAVISDVPAPESTLPPITTDVGQEGTDLFDVFKVPDTPTQSSMDALSAESSQIYAELLDRVKSGPRFRRKHTKRPLSVEQADPVIKWLEREETTVNCDLPEFEAALRNGVRELGGGDAGEASLERKKNMESVRSQKDRFCKEMGFNEKQYKLVTTTLSQVMVHCAKDAKSQALPIVWQKTKEAGMVDKQHLHTLLYVSSTFSVGNRKKRSRYGRLVDASVLDALDDVEGTTEASSEEETVDANDEIAIYHDLLYEPTEQSVLTRVNMLVSKGKAKEAQQVLDNNWVDTELHLRAYTPLLRLYLELNDASSALKLYSRMRDVPLVYFETETYIDLLANFARNGHFAESAPGVVGAKELGYTHESGPQLFDELVEQMADDCLEISALAVKRLYNAFVEGFADSNLSTISTLAPLPVSETMATSNEFIASRVRIDPKRGVCPRSGVSLRLIALSEEERERLKSSILELAKSLRLQRLEEEKAKKQTSTTEEADEDLVRFLQTLDDRKGDPFTAIVDGPNVGYYMQNYQGGGFSYHQIKFVVDSLEEMGERPLVVLPQKYTGRQFSSTVGSNLRRQVLSAEEREIQRDLIRSGKTYVVPRGLLDDFYWIVASVADQTNSCKGKSLFVSPDDDQGRWPGTRPVLVSNDRMRDHRIEMLEPRIFRRWYSSHIVNYDFSAFYDGKSSSTEISFGPADLFSREIQSNKTADGSVVWHFPIGETETEWFCVRIPKH